MPVGRRHCGQIAWSESGLRPRQRKRDLTRNWPRPISLGRPGPLPLAPGAQLACASASAGSAGTSTASTCHPRCQRRRDAPGSPGGSCPFRRPAGTRPSPGRPAAATSMIMTALPGARWQAAKSACPAWRSVAGPAYSCSSQLEVPASPVPGTGRTLSRGGPCLGRARSIGRDSSSTEPGRAGPAGCARLSRQATRRRQATPSLPPARARRLVRLKPGSSPQAPAPTRCQYRAKRGTLRLVLSGLLHCAGSQSQHVAPLLFFCEMPCFID